MINSTEFMIIATLILSGIYGTWVPRMGFFIMAVCAIGFVLMRSIGY
jgi:hypothetical protein